MLSDIEVNPNKLFEIVDYLSEFLVTKDSFLESNIYLDKGVRSFSAEEMAVLPANVRGFIHNLYQNQSLDIHSNEWLISVLRRLPEEDITIESAKFLVFLALTANVVEEVGQLLQMTNKLDAQSVSEITVKTILEFASMLSTQPKGLQ